MDNSVLINKNRNIYVGNVKKKDVIRNLYYYRRSQEIDRIYDELLKYGANVNKEDLIGTITEEELDIIATMDDIKKINGVDINVEFKNNLMLYSEKDALPILKSMFDLKYATGIFQNQYFAQFLNVMKKIRTEEQKLNAILARNNSQLKIYKPKVENETATKEEKKYYEDLESSNFEIRSSKYSISATEESLLTNLFEIEKKMVPQMERANAPQKQAKKYI